MSLNGSAFLALWNDVDPARDDEYNTWHTFEHVPERVGIDGILSGRRYVARERGEDRYFTLYELASLEVLAGRGYLDVVEHPTAWSLSMRASMRNFQRHPCATRVSLGTGIAGCVATLRFACGATAGELDAGAMRAMAEPWLEAEGITAIHLGRTVDDAAFPLANATPASSSTARRYVLLVEGVERAALLRAIPGIARQAGRALGMIEAPWCKAFDLCFQIDRASLPHSLTQRQPPRDDLRARWSTRAGTERRERRRLRNRDKMRQPAVAIPSPTKRTRDPCCIES